MPKRLRAETASPKRASPSKTAAPNSPIPRRTYCSNFNGYFWEKFKLFQIKKQTNLNCCRQRKRKCRKCSCLQYNMVLFIIRSNVSFVQSLSCKTIYSLDCNLLAIKLHKNILSIFLSRNEEMSAHKKLVCSSYHKTFLCLM